MITPHSLVMRKPKVKPHEDAKKELLNFLKKLKALEAQLWGVTIYHIRDNEEQVLEDTNHLIYKLNSDQNEIKEDLDEINIMNFKKELETIRQDFMYLKRKIKEKDILRGLISSYTIKLVNKSSFKKLERIFLLESQLYEIIDRQDAELVGFFTDVNEFKVAQDETQSDLFLDKLKSLRKILAGHMDHHELWEHDRDGFSNTSNILFSLIKEVSEDI